MNFLQPARQQGRKFLNPVPTSIMVPGSYGKLLSVYRTNKNEVIPNPLPGPFHTDPLVFQTRPASGLRITWLGHSTLLIEVDGLRILTDPVWSNRVSFTSFFGPRRFFQPPLALNDLPPLDAVILSHDHYDHLDAPVVRQLATWDMPFYCSLGVGRYLKKYGVGADCITEMNWMDQVSIGHECRLTALPARHFSGRGLFNRFHTLWSSFAIRGSRHHLYYGADSGWFEGFREIGETLGPFDLTMLEIGAYNTLFWPDIHMGPAHAAAAHQALQGRLMLPIHWGTFNLALHPWKQPIQTLLPIAAEHHIPLIVPRPGEPVTITGQQYINPWWEQ